MKGLNADHLKERVTLLQNVITKQGATPVNTHVEKQTVWAKYKPLSSDERNNDGRPLVQVDAEFIIRYSIEVAWIAAKDAVKFDGRVYDLVADPTEVVRREFISLKGKLRDANNGGH